MAVVDFNRPNPMVSLPNLDIDVCLVGDVECTTPLNKPAGGSRVMVNPSLPDRPPVFSMGLQFGFNGYLRLNATGYLQTEYYFADELSLNLETGNPPVVVGQPITLPLESEISGFFFQVGGGITRDMTAGLIALRTFDCLGQRAARVRVELVNSTGGDPVSWAFSNGIPTRLESTDAQGVAGFANVPPAAVQVEGIAPNGTRYGQVTVQVRRNQLTIAEIRPDGPYERAPQ